MQFLYRYLFPALWVGYTAYWWIMAANIKSPAKTESPISRMIRAISLILAVVLLVIPEYNLPLLFARFLPHNNYCFWIGFVVASGGLCFSIWARRQLGKNWSQAVTIKDDHQLITDGPYAIVRHPIYTGFILGFLGTSIALGELRGLVADILVICVLLYKLKLEDKWLIEQFGEPYKQYIQKVSALIPFLL